MLLKLEVCGPGSSGPYGQAGVRDMTTSGHHAPTSSSSIVGLSLVGKATHRKEIHSAKSLRAFEATFIRQPPGKIYFPRGRRRRRPYAVAHVKSLKEKISDLSTFFIKRADSKL